MTHPPVSPSMLFRSPQLASRQYLELQKVANNVWMQHFQHKVCVDHEMHACGVLVVLFSLSATCDLK